MDGMVGIHNRRWSPSDTVGSALKAFDFENSERPAEHALASNALFDRDVFSKRIGVGQSRAKARLVPENPADSAARAMLQEKPPAAVVAFSAAIGVDAARFPHVLDVCHMFATWYVADLLCFQDLFELTTIILRHNHGVRQGGKKGLQGGGVPGSIAEGSIQRRQGGRCGLLVVYYDAQSLMKLVRGVQKLGIGSAWVVRHVL